MTISRFAKLCNSNEDEFLEFKNIKEDRRLVTDRPDLHAFLLIDRLIPGTGDLVCAAEHDEIWLGVDLKKLERVASDEDLMDLHRCGVRYDSDTDSLAMFT